MTSSNAEPQSLPSEIDLVRVLEAMLESDETITLRAVARNHPTIKQASSFGRSEIRAKLIAEYQEKQQNYRAWSARAPKRSREQLARQIAQKDTRISELERQVEILRVSHILMLRAVGAIGGTAKLLDLYQRHRELPQELHRLGLLAGAEVKPFAAKKATAAD